MSPKKRTILAVERSEKGTTDTMIGGSPVKRSKIELSSSIPSYINIALPQTLTAAQHQPKVSNTPSIKLEPSSTTEEPMLQSSSKLDQCDGKSLFESETSIIRKHVNAIARSHKGDAVFESLFRSKVKLLKAISTYKDAALSEKRTLIRSTEQEVLLEMSSPDFQGLQDDGPVSHTKTEDHHVEFTIQEVSRDVRHWYGEEMKAFDPAVLQSAKGRRVSKFVGRPS